MSERHGGRVGVPRASVAVSASRRRVSESGNSDQGTVWQEARNGMPVSRPYANRPGQAQRDAEVAALVASAKAEAARRAVAAGFDPAGREQVPGPSHGCSGYTARGCRCGICTRAISLKGALARAKRNLAAGKPLTPLQAEALQMVNGTPDA